MFILTLICQSLEEYGWHIHVTAFVGASSCCCCWWKWTFLIVKLSKLNGVGFAFACFLIFRSSNDEICKEDEGNLVYKYCSFFVWGDLWIFIMFCHYFFLCFDVWVTSISLSDDEDDEEAEFLFFAPSLFVIDLILIIVNYICIITTINANNHVYKMNKWYS